jgi:uncharacterized membrane protein YccC
MKHIPARFAQLPSESPESMQLTARFRAGFLRFVRDLMLRVHEQTRPAVSKTARFTLAAVAAYVVAKWTFPNVDPLLAPLTALLVTQLTLSSIVHHFLDRVVSVVAGVLLAVGFSVWVGMSWWSLGLLIAASLIIGMLLRVGPNLLEVPISAMLVLGVGAAKTGPAAYERIVETLIGAGIGLAVNFLAPPGVRLKNAGSGIERFADEIAQTLETAADQIVDGASKEQVAAWLVRARNFSNWTPGLDGLLVDAEESRRLNMRALGAPDVGHALRGGLDALEHASVAVRSLFRGTNDLIHFPDDPDDHPDVAYPPTSRAMTSLVMREMANVVREFGVVVHSLVEPTKEMSTEALQVHIASLHGVRNEARQLFRSDAFDKPAVHELNVFLVTTTGRIIREFEPSNHDWLRGHAVAPEIPKPYVKVVSRMVARREFPARPWRSKAS